MMQEESRTKAQLLRELSRLQERVSELEQASQTFRQSEERWRSLAENAPNFIIITDSNGTIEFINRTMSGFSADRTLGRTIYDFLERGYDETAKSALKHVFRTGQPTEYEAQVTVPGDKTYWFETHVGPIKHDGKVAAATLISADITARKEAEEALKQSEETARAFFDAIPDTAVLMDTKATILAINRAGAERLGGSVGEIVGKNAQDIMPADVFEVRRSKAAEVVRTGKMVRYEDERAGLYFDTCICPVFDAQGAVERLAAFARDITLQTQLANETVELAKFPDENPNPVLRISEDCEVLYANRASSGVLKTWGIQVGQNLPEACCNRIREASSSGKVSTFEFNCDDGRIFLVTLAPVVSQRYVNAYGVDITMRKRTEEALRQSEETARAFFDAIPDTAILMDTKANILAINRAGAERLGRTVGEIVGKNAHDIFPADVFEPRWSRAAEVVRTGKMVRYEDERAGLYFNACVCPVFDAQGTVERLAVLARDVSERKKAEDALRKSEQDFKDMFENTGVGMYRTTPDGRILMANPALVRMLGYSSFDKLSQRNLEEQGFEPAYPRPAFKERIERDGQITGLESKWIRRDGTTLIIVENARVVRDETGRILYYEGTVEDITGRKKAEEALRESEEKFRTFVETASDLMHISDKDLNITDVNESMARTLGYSKQEMIGMCALEIIGAESLERDFKPNWERYLADGKISIQTNFVTKDGREIPGELKVVAFYDTNGEYAGGRAIFHDMAERKRHEEALRESEGNFRAIFDNANDGILVADPDTTQYITGNRMISQMLGYNLEEIPNLKVRDIHPEDSLTDDLRKFEKVLNREISLSDDVPIKRKDGSVFYADINTAFLRFGGKECLMGIFRDITEHKQAEERLDRYREEVAQAERLASLGTLSATLAHELTQPLTVVRLSIENALVDLETTSCPASAREQLKDSLAEISHTVSIIDRLRSFARKSSKEDVSAVDLKAVAGRIVMLLNASAQRARVTIRLKDLDKLPPIFANEKDMEQLFFALVENAIHAADGKKNRRLIISAAVEGQHVGLRFSDNCGGIAPEDLDKVFEPFFTTKSAGVGTGLGLCIAQRIVSHAGGKIRVESKTGKGSTFSITLPLNKAGRS